MVLSCLQDCQFGSKFFQIGSKILPSWPQDRQLGLQDRPSWPQDPPSWRPRPPMLASRPPTWPPKASKMASWRASWSLLGPCWGQGGPRIPPRCPQEPPGPPNWRQIASKFDENSNLKLKKNQSFKGCPIINAHRGGPSAAAQLDFSYYVLCYLNYFNNIIIINC